MHYANVLSEYIHYDNSFDYSFVKDDVTLADWNKLLRTANYAKRSNHQFRIAALVYGKKPLAAGFNQRRSHPLVPLKRASIHAEVAALQLVNDPLGTTLYVARLDASDCLAPARPCLHCVGYMIKHGVDRVVYSESPNTCGSFHLNMVSSSLLME